MVRLFVFKPPREAAKNGASPTSLTHEPPSVLRRRRGEKDGSFCPVRRNFVTFLGSARQPTPLSSWNQRWQSSSRAVFFLLRHFFPSCWHDPLGERLTMGLAWAGREMPRPGVRGGRAGGPCPPRSSSPMPPHGNAVGQRPEQNPQPRSAGLFAARPAPADSIVQSTRRRPQGRCR